MTHRFEPWLIDGRLLKQELEAQIKEWDKSIERDKELKESVQFWRGCQTAYREILTRTRPWED